MPECPEVTLSRDFLRHEILNKKIASIQLYPSGRYREGRKKPNGYDHFMHYLRNYEPRVQEIDVKGKLLWWKMDVDLYLAATYGMSGQWRTRPCKHETYSFGFADGSNIYFEDIRHFGTLSFLNKQEWEKKLSSLGPDMLNAPPSLDEFKTLLKKRRRGQKTLPEVLMNQKVISGVGNYIKAESLYRAKLSPHRTVDSLSEDDFKNLYTSIRYVMELAYRQGGATIRSFSNPDGKEGYATKYFLVYRHEKDPLGYPVISEETKDKRTTWWCPEMQK